jgi:hypothetical protein
MKQQEEAPKLSAALRAGWWPVASRPTELKARFFEMQLSEPSLLYPLLTGRATKPFNRAGCRSRGAT